MSLPWDTFETAPPPAPGECVIVIGAGLAGCWLARLLAEKGVSVNLLDSQSTAGRGASANVAGIVKPFVTRQPSAAMQFHVEAHEFLLRQLDRFGFENACNFNNCGVLQLTRHEYPPTSHYRTLDCRETQIEAGTPVISRSLHFSDSGWLSPTALCQQLIRHPLVTLGADRSIVDIRKSKTADAKNQWVLQCSDKATLRSRHVVIANGHCMTQFKQTEHLPIIAARGQISRFRLKGNSATLHKVISGKHYVIPDRHSILIGATFERGNQDPSVRDSDHQSNLEGLRKLLPDIQVESRAIEGFAGVRATTPDRLPLMGPLADHAAVQQSYESIHHGRPLSSYPSLPVLPGLFVIGGLGSRGIVTAPWVARALVNILLHETASDSADSMCRCTTLCNPVRFQIRSLKRRYNRAAESTG